MMVIYIKVFLVVLILVGMIMVLVGIRHLFCRQIMDFDDKESDDLRRDVENSMDVISDTSVFYNFLVRSLDSRRGRIHTIFWSRKERGKKQISHFK